MAVPTSFDGSNDHLDRPKDMESCEALSILRLTMETHGEMVPVVISCWKLTKEELDEINRTGRVWLVLAGHTMPPAEVNGIKPFTNMAEVLG